MAKQPPKSGIAEETVEADVTSPGGASTRGGRVPAPKSKGPSTAGRVTSGQATEVLIALKKSGGWKDAEARKGACEAIWPFLRDVAEAATLPVDYKKVWAAGHEPTTRKQGKAARKNFGTERVPYTKAALQRAFDAVVERVSGMKDIDEGRILPVFREEVQATLLQEVGLERQGTEGEWRYPFDRESIGVKTTEYLHSFIKKSHNNGVRQRHPGPTTPPLDAARLPALELEAFDAEISHFEEFAKANPEKAGRLAERYLEIASKYRAFDGRRVLTAQEGSELLGLTPAMLRKLGRDGLLGECREGSWYFSAEEIRWYAENRPKPGPKPKTP